jgi:hypothetical protein
MTNRLIALSLSLMLGAAAVTAIAANTADAQPRANNPVQLAQNNATPPGPRGRGPARTPPTGAELASRRTERCDNLSAMAAGRLAYMEARLDLTAAQRAAFTRWRDIRLAAAKRMAGTCAEQPARGPGRGANASATRPSPVERMARQETRLRQRLADLQVERPALEALYNSLTPEQRQKFTPPGNGPRGGMMGRAPRMAMMMRDRMGPRGGMMRGGPNGPMGGPMDRMGPPPGDQPPPPPPAQ